MGLRDHLDAIYRADRSIREEETQLLASGDAAALEVLLVEAVAEARELRDRREARMRLERLADLCAQLHGPKMADALLDILDDEDPAVRAVAGDALLDVGYERYAEVARAIERALEKKRSGPAMAELPWVLSEIGEPSALPLIKRFLQHSEAEVVGSAVEALAELGDAGAIEALQALRDDRREVTLEDGDEELTTTIGELAREAIEELGGDEA